MYVNPVLVGVVGTIFVEVALLAIYAIFKGDDN